jgi:hypothetical protein
MLQRLIFGLAGLVIWGLVVLAIRAGWYTAQAGRISRKTQPGLFWTVMGLGAVFGGAFVAFGLFL